MTPQGVVRKADLYIYIYIFIYLFDFICRGVGLQTLIVFDS